VGDPREINPRVVCVPARADRALYSRIGSPDLRNQRRPASSRSILKSTSG